MKQPGIAVTLLLTFCLSASAEQPTHMDITQIKASGFTDDGAPIQFPATSSPFVKVTRISLPPGEASGWHIHHGAVYAYIASGTLELDYGDRKIRYNSGDVMFEPTDRRINVTNPGKKTATAIVFAMGSKDRPITAYPDD